MTFIIKVVSIEKSKYTSHFSIHFQTINLSNYFIQKYYNQNQTNSKKKIFHSQKILSCLLLKGRGHMQTKRNYTNRIFRKQLTLPCKLLSDQILKIG